jgi:integrase
MTEDKAGRYPFRHATNEYLQAYHGLFATSTYNERIRRYSRMAKDIEALFDSGKIVSPDPAKITPEDVKEFYLMLKNRGLSQNDIAHEITALKSLCLFRGNNAVDVCRQKYPIIKGRLPTFRLPTTPYSIFNDIISMGNRYEGDYEHLRDYAVVTCAYCAGMRPVEIQHARIENLDLKKGVIYVDVVKGQGSYGEPRYIPIHPAGLTILTRYVQVRNARWGNGGYLFRSNVDKPLSTNMLRRYKNAVQEAVSHKFDFREGRRTFGQLLIDEGASVEDVAVIMGHRTSRTTENYYARRTQRSAITNVFKIWEKRRKELDE